MVKSREKQTGPTTIYTTWELKDKIAKFRKQITRYKNRKKGIDRESDHQMLQRIFTVFQLCHKLKNTTDTTTRESILSEIFTFINEPEQEPKPTFSYN